MSRLLDDIRQNHWEELGQNIRIKMAETQVVTCDQVTEYMFVLNDKEYWDIYDFPNVMPPFKNFWLETKAPSCIVSEEFGRLEWREKRRPKAWGALFLEGPRSIFWEDPRLSGMGTYTREEVEENVVTVLNATMLIQDWDDVVLPFWAWSIPIMKDGLIWRKHDPVLNRDISGMSYTLQPETHQWLTTPEGRKRYEDLRSEAHAYMNPLLLAICFMHAKNVTLVPQHPSPKLQKARQRRGRAPLLSFKVLEVGPLKRILEASRRQNAGSPESLQVALHRCRGHFKQYTPEKPLLGRAVGTFFWNEHIRGDKGEQHAVRKEYNVKKPKL